MWASSTSPTFPTILFTSGLGLIPACLGYIGMWKKMNIFFILHIIGLSSPIILNLCVAIISPVKLDEFYTMSQQALDDSVKYYYKIDEYADEFDMLHTNFHCCGANSYADFRKARLLIPYSCRILQFVYARGCLDELHKFVEYYVTVLMSICFFTSIIHTIFLVISIIHLRRSIKRINKDVEIKE
uniref:SJCHGC06637 protein n=1 Tax=Schistosoma japonicum TaxID=6182 RepID=Q5D9F9_SCHJA|nr:SJCHGC06637 protein [Schistosoma japonicum]